MRTSPERTQSFKTLRILVIGALGGMCLCLILIAAYIFGNIYSPLSSNFTKIPPSPEFSVIPSTPSQIIITQTDTTNPNPPIIIATAEPSIVQNASIPERQLARVTKIIDGDTIEVDINGVVYPLRYIGIDSPEPGEVFSHDATEANRNLVENQVIELVKDVSDVDRYERLLRYVYLPDGRMVNAELIAMGYAVAKAYPPDTKYQELFTAQQQEAQQAYLGMWQQLTPTPTFSTALPVEMTLMVDQSCSQFNAPGDDNKNLVEEYVCIRNGGAQSVQLLNWTIRDEYGWTFTFPDFALAAGSAVKIHTGCGEANQSDLYWCRAETAIWNNGGDCVHLLDQDGSQVQEYCY